MSVILFTNLKGGVAKTTNAVALAECLASSGKPTLVIDADHQRTASEMLLGESRLDSLDHRKRTLHDLLLRMIKTDFEKAQFDKYVERNVSNIGGGLEHLSVIPCSTRINDFAKYDAKARWESGTGREFKRFFDVHRHQLKRWLATNFAYTIIDCPPSLATHVKHLVGISDTYVIPCQPNRLSVRGAALLRKSIQKAGYKRDCLGILWSMCRGNDRVQKNWIASARAGERGLDRLPTPFTTTIPLAVRIAHAVEGGVTCPKTLRAKYGTEFARIFVRLANEIIGRLETGGYSNEIGSPDTLELAAV